MSANCPHCGAALVPGQPLCTDCGKPPAEGSAPRSRSGAGPPGASPAAAPPQPRGPRRDKLRDFHLVGKTVAGKYKVLEVLGQGGFGTVYLVEITAGMVGEKLAMKVLPEELSSQPAFRNQFLDEIRIAMRVVDRYIAQIRDVGTTEDGLLYYTMDLCPGVTLAQLLREEGKLAVTRTLLIVLNVLRGLGTAHASGIIHRDLKPANIMVLSQGGKDTVRILDFGIATAVQTTAGAAGEKQRGFAGSPQYMPPEQFLGEPVGFSADLYALGVILYECLSGQRPYPGSSAQEVFKSLKTRTPAPLESVAPEVAGYPGLSELVMKALEKNPERRFQSARELFDAVNAVLTDATSPAGSRAAGAGVPAGSAAAARPAAPAPAVPAAPSQGAPGGPPPSARAAAERIRRRRTSAAARRPGSRAGAVALATFIVASTVLGVLFNKEIARWWKGRTESSAGTAAAPPAGPAKPAQEGAKKAAASTAAVEPQEQVREEKAIEEQKTAALAGAAARAAKLVGEGMKALDSKDWRVALERSESAVGLDAQNAAAHRIRGIASLRLLDFTAAEASLEEARALSRPGGGADPALLTALAEAKMGISPPALADAEALVKEALRNEPKSADATLLLARVLDAEGKRAEARIVVETAVRAKVASPALEALRKKLEVDDAAKTRAEAARLAVAASEAYARGDFAAAAELAGKSRGLEPSPAADLIAIDGLVELGRLEDASAVIEESLARRPGGPPGPPAELATRLELRRQYVAGRIALAGEAKDPSGRDLPGAEAALSRAREKLAGTAGKDDARWKPLVLLALARARAMRADAAGVKEALEWLEREQVPTSIAEGARVYLALAKAIEKPEARAQAFALARKTLQALLRLKELPDELRREGSYLLGTVHLALADLEKNESYCGLAVTSFAAAEKAGLKTTELYEAWAEAYDRTGNLIRAAQLFRSAYELAPSPERCLRAVESYLNANPKSPEAASLLKEGRERFKESREIRKKCEEVLR